jgi:hypothetical protein
MTFDQSDFRLQCRVSCGADHVVENVWPYSLPPDFVRSYVNSYEEESEDEIEDFDDNTGEEDNDDDDEDDDDNVEEFDEEDEWQDNLISIGLRDLAGNIGSRCELMGDPKDKIVPMNSSSNSALKRL